MQMKVLRTKITYFNEKMRTFGGHLDFTKVRIHEDSPLEEKDASEAKWIWAKISEQRGKITFFNEKQQFGGHFGFLQKFEYTT